MLRVNSFRETVHASKETIWELLLDRIANPGAYLPGVESSEILERSSEGFIRETRARGLVIRERVVVDEKGGEVRFELLEHPLFSGSIVNRVVPTSAQSPVAPQTLTLILDWAPKNPEAERIVLQEMAESMQRAVIEIKERAEELDREPPPKGFDPWRDTGYDSRQH